MDPEYVRAEGYEHKRIQGRVYWTLKLGQVWPEWKMGIKEHAFWYSASQILMVIYILKLTVPATFSVFVDIRFRPSSFRKISSNIISTGPSDSVSKVKNKNCSKIILIGQNHQLEIKWVWYRIFLFHVSPFGPHLAHLTFSYRCYQFIVMAWIETRFSCENIGYLILYDQKSSTTYYIVLIFYSYCHATGYNSNSG